MPNDEQDIKAEPTQTEVRSNPDDLSKEDAKSLVQAISDVEKDEAAELLDGQSDQQKS